MVHTLHSQYCGKFPQYTYFIKHCRIRSPGFVTRHSNSNKIKRRDKETENKKYSHRITQVSNGFIFLYKRTEDWPISDYTHIIDWKIAFCYINFHSGVFRLNGVRYKWEVCTQRIEIDDVKNIDSHYKLEYIIRLLRLRLVRRGLQCIQFCLQYCGSYFSIDSTFLYQQIDRMRDRTWQWTFIHQTKR